MTVTLADIAKVEKSPFAKAVILDLLRQSDLLKLVSINSVPGLRMTGRRWQVLPSSQTRKINGGYAQSDGHTEEVNEGLFVYGGEVFVDRILQKAAGSLTEAPETTQMKMMVEALSYQINTDFINGDHVVNPEGFEGLRVRVANGLARQRVSLATAGDSLKVLANDANEQTFLDGLHEIVHKTGATALFMNEHTFLQFGAVLRRTMLYNMIKDQGYDKVWTMFGDAKLVDVGVQGDQATEIITSTEDPGDGGNDATSIYAVRFGSDDGLRMLQLEGTSPKPYKLGEDAWNLGNTMRIDWAIGMENVGKYAVGRLSGFKMAAI